MKPKGFNENIEYFIDVSKEHEIGAGELVDGYETHSATQKKRISFDNAHKMVDDEIIRPNILNFKKKRTLERKTVKIILYRWIEEKFEIENIYNKNCFIINNKVKFEQMILETCQRYKDKRDAEDAKIEPKEIKWKLANQKFSGDIEKFIFNKYVYKECWLKKDRSNLEKEFEKYIDDEKDVVWWYKNGDYGSKYLGIPYKINNEAKLFYPDFIVKFNDKMRIYDTKGGLTLDVAKLKAEALYEYIKENKLDGGIITKHGNVWKINLGKDYTNNVEKWNYL